MPKIQLPLLSGIKANQGAEFAMSYPLNLEPVIIDSKISKGQLRTAAGFQTYATGPGLDRGGIFWGGYHIRIMGQYAVVIRNGVYEVIGEIGGAGPVTMDFGFDRLAVRSEGELWYINQALAMTQVTDADLPPIIDMLWIDGFYMVTDGTHVIVTELSDPSSILPLKYGSAEEDPDMVTGLLKVRNEAYVFGRYTIQVLENRGGNGFPFQTVQGATIPYGAICPTAKCRFGEGFAFVGSAKGEALGVYSAGGDGATKLSTREIDDALAKVQDETAIIVENRTYRDERRLIVHLPDESWCFFAKASATTGEPVWVQLKSGRDEPYRARNATMVGTDWIVGDLNSAQLAILDEESSAHFGQATEWRFDAGLLWNESAGVILHSVELVGLMGRGNGSAFLSMTRDGQSFTSERALSTGADGQTSKRLQWRPHTRFRNYMGLRFRGYDEARQGFATVMLDVEPLVA